MTYRGPHDPTLPDAVQLSSVAARTVFVRRYNAAYDVAAIQGGTAAESAAMARWYADTALPGPRIAEEAPPDDDADLPKVSLRFLSKLRELLKAGTDFDEAVRKARSHAGGKASARAKRERASATATEFDVEPQTESSVAYDSWNDPASVYQPHYAKTDERISYRDADTVGQQCASCQQFLGAACRVVEGRIEANYVCDMFMARASMYAEKTLTIPNQDDIGVLIDVACAECDVSLDADEQSAVKRWLLGDDDAISMSEGSPDWKAAHATCTEECGTGITPPDGQSCDDYCDEVAGKAGTEPQAFAGKGNISAIIKTFGSWAGMSHTTCTAKLASKGFKDVDALCAWLKDRAVGNTKWRGKKHGEPDDALEFHGRHNQKDHAGKGSGGVSSGPHTSDGRRMGPDGPGGMDVDTIPERGKPTTLGKRGGDKIVPRADTEKVLRATKSGDKIEVELRSGYKPNLSFTKRAGIVARTGPTVASDKGGKPLLTLTETYSFVKHTPADTSKASEVIQTPFRLFLSFAEAATDTTPEWIPYLPTPGTYKHPSYGEVKITKARNSRFVKHFGDRVYQHPIPLDAEHETKMSGAVAWVTDLRQNADGSVDAQVDWTSRGRAFLEGDRFRFVSPEWFDLWTDPATGTVYRDVAIGGALTTRPFFKDNAGGTALRSLVAREDGLYAVEADGTEHQLDAVQDAGDEGGSVPEPIVTPEGAQDTSVIASLQAQIAELTTTVGQMRSMAETATTEAQTYRERVGVLESERQERRFTEMVTGRAGEDDGRPWAGQTEAHVSTLSALAETFGEESEQFTGYVTNQRAIAEQVRNSALFTEIGVAGRKPASSAMAEAEARAKKMQEASPTLNHDAAMSRVFKDDPALYDRVNAEG